MHPSHPRVQRRDIQAIVRALSETPHKDPLPLEQQPANYQKDWPAAAVLKSEEA